MVKPVQWLFSVNSVYIHFHARCRDSLLCSLNNVQYISILGCPEHRYITINLCLIHDGTKAASTGAASGKQLQG